MTSEIIWIVKQVIFATCFHPGWRSKSGQNGQDPDFLCWVQEIYRDSMGFPSKTSPSSLDAGDSRSLSVSETNHGSVIFQKKNLTSAYSNGVKIQMGSYSLPIPTSFATSTPRGDQPQSHWWPGGGVVDSRHADNSSRESSVPWTNRKCTSSVTRCTWLVWPWGY